MQMNLMNCGGVNFTPQNMPRRERYQKPLQKKARTLKGLVPLEDEMTKLKELAIKDLNNFNSIEMAKLYGFIQLIKEKKQVMPPKMNTSYLKVREALQSCTGSLSEDILQEREESI